jgi:glycosidase
MVPLPPRTLPFQLAAAACVLVVLGSCHEVLGKGQTRARGAEPPAVSKVEPPNWWANHSINPVRLLVRGRHLHGARVTTSAAGLSIGLTRVNERGTYLFVDVHIAADTRPGATPLIVTTTGGSATIPFEISESLPRAGRFQGFDEDDAIYLIMPDRFANGDLASDNPAKSPGLLDRGKKRYYHGGDLQGIIDRLPYLKDLGVTALWLNPWYDNNDRLNTRERYDNEDITDYHGFGAVDFYGVEERLGDMQTLRTLVSRAHALGIKIIQDQVANHTGPFHPWAEDPPTPTWFNGTAASHLANTFQTHLLMDPNSPPAVTRPTLDGWFIDILPDLNQADEEVHRYWIQNSLWWAGMTGMDGIRQDTVPYVPRWFWRDWMAALEREYPRLSVVGEVLDGSAPFVSFFQAGRAQFDGVDSGLDTLFDYPLFFGIRKAFGQGQSIREAVNVLHQDHLYPAPHRLVTLLGSHDVPRFMHEQGATIEGLALASTFLFTVRGTPQWYYGDEIAMPGGGDPDNRRTMPGGWPGDPRNVFEASGRTSQEQAVFSHVRALMRLRQDLEPLRRGRQIHLAIGDQTYAFARESETGTVVVALNNDTRPQTLRVDVTATRLTDGQTLVDRLSVAGDVRVGAGAIEVTLPARAGAVYTVR